jgi:hypothetical protein
VHFDRPHKVKLQFITLRVGGKGGAITRKDSTTSSIPSGATHTGGVLVPPVHPATRARPRPDPSPAPRPDYEVSPRARFDGPDFMQVAAPVQGYRAYSARGVEADSNV